MGSQIREEETAGLVSDRIVQVHLTADCNLSCLHCYSNSGPGRGVRLERGAIRSLLSVLWQEGYRVLSLSGGEPFMHPQLEAIVADAVLIGYRVNLITNLMLANERKLRALRDSVEFFGVSLDGQPATHNRIRGSDSAFARTNRKLALMREVGIPFLISHCVTRESVGDIPWLADHAQQVGARGLRLHPLSAFGRANENKQLGLSAYDLERVYLLARVLESGTPEAFSVGCDLMLKRSPAVEQGLLFPLDACSSEQRLADLVNPLVVEENGRVGPYSYGLAVKHRITAVGAPAPESEIASWKRLGIAPLRRHVATVLDRVRSDAGQVAAWYDGLAEAAG